MINKDLDFNEVELSKLNIHELRELARSVGVISPTTKAKKELIQKILTIIYGEAEVPAIKSGAGRPARTKTKPSKILYAIDKNQEDVDNIFNPFVKMFEEQNENLFNEYKSSNSDFDIEYNNGKNKTDLALKVASSKSDYLYDDDQENEEFKNVSPKLIELGNKVRKLLGRESIINSEPREEFIDDIDMDACLFIEGIVFLGEHNKLFVAFPENDEDKQEIYLIPEQFVKLFAIRAGDFIEGIADNINKIIVSVDAINGKVIFD